MSVSVQQIDLSIADLDFDYRPASVDERAGIIDPREAIGPAPIRYEQSVYLFTVAIVVVIGVVAWWRGMA